jgi:hypothetical protein
METIFQVKTFDSASTKFLILFRTQALQTRRGAM